MTYPSSPPQPLPPTGPRVQTGSARYGELHIHKPCPQCGSTECVGDERWQHERDYRGSESTWWRMAVAR